MCRKLTCLIIFALVLALSGLAQAELLVNPGFEAGLEGWNTWGGGSGSGAGGWFYNSDTHATVMENGTANSGDKHVEIGIADVEGSWWAVMLAFQEQPVTEGKAYEISGWFRDADANGAPSLVEGGGKIEWEWRDAAPTSEGRGAEVADRNTLTFNLTEEWTYQSNVQIAPPGAKGLTVVLGTTWGGINMDVDDGSFGPVQVAIPVQNAGFEDPVLAEDDWTWIDVPGWTHVGGEGPGIWHVTSADFDPVLAPEGQNVLYTENAVGDGGGVTQVLTETFAANTDYILTADIGNSYYYYFSGYSVQLLAGGVVIAEDNDTLWPDYMNWAASTVSYTYDPADAALVGQPLEIRLLTLALDKDSPPADTAVGVEFDNVTLSRIASVTAQGPDPADDAIRVSPEPVLSVYDSDDVPLDIPDRWMTTTKVYSSLDIPESFTITDLNVQLDITQPNNNADLNVFLIGPDGTRVELFTDVGVTSKDDFKNTILDDEASVSVRDGRGRFEGTYRPEGKLSNFDGKNAHGTWKLEISDDFAGNVGTLNSWRLIIESPNVLSWTPADLAATQDVYISKNLDDVIGSAEAAFFGNFAPHVSTLEIILEVGQQYFWRIDSVDADGALIATGDVWSFWTTPEPIFVDPDSDLAAANELAIPGGIIEFAAGTYNITSQIIVKEGVTYVGAGPESTIIDGGGATRAFAAWGDRGATNGQVDAEGNAIQNFTGPTRWVIEGMTIQNCVSDEVNRQNILSAARDLLNNYTGTPYTLATAS
ncbi:MAG: proprotein convertase P-domain-containing protein, partial [Planctomycetota bacterium]